MNRSPQIQKAPSGAAAAQTERPEPASVLATKRSSRVVATIYAALLAGFFLLLFYNLDGHLFWGDEAENATLAKNVLRYGIPKTFDGTNRITLYGGQVDANTNDVWTWSPWLQQYVTAAGFSVFGTTTWGGRALFAFIGWLSLGLLALVAFQIYRSHWIALGAVLLTGTSEVFLLHMRQCRYYSISVLAEILFACGLYQLLRRQWRGVWVAGLALLLQFYSNYIVTVANLPALLLLGGMLFKEDRRFPRRVAVSMGILLLGAAPWVIFAQPWHQSAAIPPGSRFVKARFYASEFQFHFVPFAVVLLPLGSFVARRMAAWRAPRLAEGASPPVPGETRTAGADALPEPPAAGPEAIRKFERLLLAALPLYFLVILVPPGAFLRYLLPLLPLACLLSAAWLFRCAKWRTAAVGIMATQCATNALAVATAFPWAGQHPLRWPLVEYIRGIGQPYRDRLADVAEFLNSHAQPGETVFVFDPEFPLIFYTRQKIVNATLNHGLITQPLPDWILSESASGVLYPVPLELPPELKPYYESITIPVHDSFRRASMPEPDLYRYQTAPLKAYTIFKLRKPLRGTSSTSP